MAFSTVTGCTVPRDIVIDTSAMAELASANDWKKEGLAGATCRRPQLKL